MSIPIHVPTDQWMGERREFARHGAHTGPAAAVARYDGGVVLVSANASPHLHRIGEIHDRLAMVGAGRFHEVDRLRITGIRQADLRAYAYDRLDVTGRALASTFSRLMGATMARFDEKPYEVELAVAELGAVPAQDRIFTVAWDGTVHETTGPVTLGGVDPQAAQVSSTQLAEPTDLGTTLTVVTEALASTAGAEGEAAPPEVAVLERHGDRRRRFRRLGDEEVAAWTSRP